MPQAINLTIKNAVDADKTFELITPAAGDGGIAEWALKEGVISSVFPRLTASAHKTPRGRVLTTKLRLPSSYQDAVTGLTNVGSAAEVNIKVSMPADYPEAKKDDFVAFTRNVISHALLQSMMRDATSAN